jgi:hypothetical protein
MLTHWMADALTLWKVPLTDAHLFTAASYYALLSTMPQLMIWVLVAVVLFGTIALFMSFSDQRAGNVMFDGASICKCLCLSVTNTLLLIHFSTCSFVPVRTSSILLLGCPASPTIRSAPTIRAEPPKLPTVPQRPHRRAGLFSSRRICRTDGGDDPAGSTVLGRRGGRRSSRE